LVADCGEHLWQSTEVVQAMTVGQHLRRTRRHGKPTVEPVTCGIVGDGHVAVDSHHLQPLDCVARLGLGSLGQFGRGHRPLGQRVQPAQAVTEVQVEGLHGAESGIEELVCKFFGRGAGRRWGGVVVVKSIPPGSRSRPARDVSG
jgi:hypothetical protein